MINKKCLRSVIILCCVGKKMNIIPQLNGQNSNFVFARGNYSRVMYN